MVPVRLIPEDVIDKKNTKHFFVMQVCQYILGGASLRKFWRCPCGTIGPPVERIFVKISSERQNGFSAHRQMRHKLWDKRV